MPHPSHFLISQYLRVAEELTWVVRSSSHCLALWKYSDYLDYNAFRQCYNEINYAMEHLNHLHHNFPQLFRRNQSGYANCEPLLIAIRGKIEALLAMFYQHPQDGIFEVPDLHPALVRTNFWMLKDAWKTAAEALEYGAQWFLPVMLKPGLLKDLLPVGIRPETVAFIVVFDARFARHLLFGIMLAIRKHFGQREPNQGEVLQTVASMSINRNWAPQLHQLTLSNRLQATWRDDSFVNNRCIMIYHWNNRKFVGGHCDETWHWVCFRSPTDDVPMLHLKYPVGSGGITEPLNELPANNAWREHIDPTDAMRIEFPDPYYWEPVERMGEGGAVIP